MSATPNPHPTTKERVAEINRLNSVLSDVQHLVSALQIVCWDLSGHSTFEPQLVEIRGAVIGLGDALELVTKEALK